MRLSLIGMSGSGKSYWSMRLAELGFHRFCCDDLIEAELGSELLAEDGTAVGLGEWMGFPFEPHYEERESAYLEYERKVLAEVLGEIKRGAVNPDLKIVIDTTGSVIYTGEEILRSVCRHTTVVHLATPPEVKEQMLKVYVTNPRPILWRDLFRKMKDETNQQALARCYPRLLHSRERLYEKYADVTITYHNRNTKNFTVNNLLEEIESHRSKQ